MAIKISDINKRSSINSPSQKENIKTIASSQNSFGNKLQKLSGDALQSQINMLLDDIENQAQTIEKKFNLNDIIKYKKKVKEFLNLTVNNSHEFSKDSFLDRRGRHKILSIVRKVDNELEGLTKDFLDKEKDNLKIVKRLDDIRGLLLDIFM